MPTRNAEIVSRRHPEFLEHVMRWQWLLDSLEGGERYRRAVYTLTSPVSPSQPGMGVWSDPGSPTLKRRNLIQHKHEDDERGADGTLRPNRDYQLRLERTPVPGFVAEAIEAHMSEIFSKEIQRESPEPLLKAWWEDVDGTGAPIDDWMSDTLAPTLFTLGQIDVLFDRPAAPEGIEVATRADVERLGLSRCVASVILPENLPWWELAAGGKGYEEALVIEYHEMEDSGSCMCIPLYRHWTTVDSTLYAADGTMIGTPSPHPYGVVPIVRVFDSRKIRCRHIGQSRYEVIAELQREYYNVDSEMVLSNTTQAHPIMQGPEDYLTQDATIPIGPNHILPMKKSLDGTTTTYQGFQCIDMPKGPADSLRAELQRIRDAVDRAAKLTKPAGAHGTSGSTVAQSGISKALDQKAGNALLTRLARTLASAERDFAVMALTVLGADPNAKVEVVYPSSFSLLSAEEVATIAADFQEVLATSGDCPESETLFLQALVREGLPGKDDRTYRRLDKEIEAAVEEKATTREQMRESPPPMLPPPVAAPAVPAALPTEPPPMPGGGKDLQHRLTPIANGAAG